MVSVGVQWYSKAVVWWLLVYALNLDIMLCSVFVSVTDELYREATGKLEI